MKDVTVVAPESIGKAVVRSFATSVAMSVGVFGGMALVGTLIRKKEQATNDSDLETQES